MWVLVSLIYLAFLFVGLRRREGRERVIYLVLAIVSVISASLAGSFLGADHVGASLSGMISIFMR